MIKRAARAVGKAIDKEDRQFMVQAVIRIIGGAVVVLSGAGIIGLAVRVFLLAAG